MGSKKILTGLSLAALAVAVVTANTWFSPSNQAQTPERGIASADPNTSESSKEWEQRLAQVLAEGEERLPASLRSRPSEIQQLAFGLLEGRYSLAFAKGRVSEIRLLTSEGAKDIGALPDFFEKNRSVLLENFASIVPRNQKDKDRGEQTASFDLLDKNSKIIASAEVTTNEEGELLHLKITNL